MKKITIFFLALMLTGCFPQPAQPKPESTIQLTASESTVVMGDSVGLTIEVGSSQPVQEVYLSVGDVPFSRSEISAKSASALIIIEKIWVADQPGAVRIEAYALRTDGTVIGPAVAEISVKAANTPTNGPTQINKVNGTLQPTSGVDTVPSITPTVPHAELNLNINVDNDYLFAGDCTTLRWKAEDVDAVWLDGAIVDKEDAREICPTETSEYVLEAVKNDGRDSTSVLVVVEEFLEDDSIGPVVTEIKFEPMAIYTGENCADETSAFSTKVSDESEVLLASLFYRVVSGDQFGEWQEILLEKTSDDVYSYSFGQADIEENLEGTVEGKLEFYVDAMDFMVNETKTEVETLPIQVCSK